jgi:secreted PhoX family phosphatase
MKSEETISNPSGNPTLSSLLDARLSRREVLKGGMGLATLAFFGPSLLGPDSRAAAREACTGVSATIGFKPVPASKDDAVHVPEGYEARVLIAWGDPVSDGPAFKQDASNTAAEQQQQYGMHNDGMHFFSMAEGDSSHGLLVVNHEYTDDGLLHSDGMATWSAEKVKKSQAAHGVSVIEIKQVNGEFQVVRPSRFARRITAYSPIAIAGPAAGHALLRTEADPAGLTMLGTLNNCANGHTPWGTYLACEENWHGYFVNPGPNIPAGQQRYGISAEGYGFRWHKFDTRFDAAKHPNEPNRFGWVVEIDPRDPASTPVKRTALGRFKHEGAAVVLSKNRHVVVYMGDDEPFEYIYKFVSKEPFNGAGEAGNKTLLDQGTLYVAKFNDDGGGEWLPLVHGRNGLTAEKGFNSQAEVLIKARLAADTVGATKMDRPEWIAVHPETQEVYCALTNNSKRGADSVNKVNPRASNAMGHILRWCEAESDPASTRFRWDVFVLCGDSANSDPNHRGNVSGDAFGSPDGLAFDGFGRLWVATDISTAILNTGPYARIGNNQLLAVDIQTRKAHRFLTGPVNCEVTGITWTPDYRTLFVNIQHPGEPHDARTDPAQPKARSSWPDGASGRRPRSATLVIRRKGGGRIGD